jgi:malate dehydrogenase (oxaloacetate-decarboxylating)(NADP+)
LKRRDALSYHADGKPGKIEVNPTKPCLTQRDLSLAYTPGVAEPCLEIAKDPEKSFLYTARGNLVAVVTNGTAVLGLGNIGPAAGKPVMEGKAVLFKRFAGIDVFDIELNAPDVESFCQAVKALEPTFGGINIEDVKAPDCFLIEERLRREMDIPVFHDDQHGTAIITAAGLINALTLQNKRMEQVRIVFSGAGAAAIACADLLVSLGADPEKVLMCDTAGVLRHGRPEPINPFKVKYTRTTSAVTLADAMRGADVFIGVSARDCVNAEMLKSMAPRPVVFAMANPDPEIPYPAAVEARPDAIVATGRSDYPNQVNNVLGFPFIFRGALDVRARKINEEMKRAAVHALADLARQEVPEAVSEAYGGRQFRFGPEYIIPKPLDSRVLLWVAPAVAKAATDSGVARKPITDVNAYREHLEKMLGKEREVMRYVVNRARTTPKRIVLPEGDFDKTLKAAAILLEEKIAEPILLGQRDVIQNKVAAMDLDLDLDKVQIEEPVTSPKYEAYWQEFWRLRRRKGITDFEAQRYLRWRTHFGAMMVRLGDADGMVVGLGASFPETLRPTLQIVGTDEQSTLVGGVHIMVVKNEIFFFADTTVTIDSTPEQMAEVACMTADLARSFDVQPRVAVLSFSNYGSVDHPAAHKARHIAELVRRMRPELIVDGEIHADLALMPEFLNERYPFNTLKDKANVLIFPTLESGNIAYKIAQCFGAQATIGPILVGLKKPVNILARYATVNDVVLTVALTAMMAGAKDARILAAARERLAPQGRMQGAEGQETARRVGLAE